LPRLKDAVSGQFSVFSLENPILRDIPSNGTAIALGEDFERT
jgi:hypothetical protein